MAEYTPIHPEDVLPDGVETTTIAGVDVRKGTVAAFIANARQLERLAPDDARRGVVEHQLRCLAPALRAVGLLEVFAPRSADIEAILAPGDQSKVDSP